MKIFFFLLFVWIEFSGCTQQNHSDISEKNPDKKVVIEKKKACEHVKGRPFVFNFKCNVASELKLSTYSDLEYSYNIDWGDGRVDSCLTHNKVGFVARRYPAGIYTVSISGAYPALKFYDDSNAKDSEISLEVMQWGDQKWQRLDSAFCFARAALDLNAKDAPNLEMVSSLNASFATDKIIGDVSQWDLSHIVAMKGTFSQANEIDLKGINAWDVSHVKYTNDMFLGSGFDQKIEDWEVSNVVDMSRMFLGSEFNKSIEAWNVSKVKSMKQMFAGSKFDHPINRWKVGAVEDMHEMFASTAFDQALDQWDVSQVKDMRRMFSGNDRFDKDISTWNVHNVRSMAGMFGSISDFYGGDFLARNKFAGDISRWDVSHVKDMSLMFFGNLHFNGDLSNWDVSHLEDMTSMFASSNFNGNITTWNTKSIRKCLFAFENDKRFDQDLSGWDMGKADFDIGMFGNTKLLDRQKQRVLHYWEEKIKKKEIKKMIDLFEN